MSLLNTCKDKLAQVASVVDEICAVDKQFTINKDGEPVLKDLLSPNE